MDPACPAPLQSPPARQQIHTHTQPGLSEQTEALDPLRQTFDGDVGQAMGTPRSPAQLDVPPFPSTPRPCPQPVLHPEPRPWPSAASFSRRCCGRCPRLCKAQAGTATAFPSLLSRTPCHSRRSGWSGRFACPSPGWLGLMPWLSCSCCWWHSGHLLHGLPATEGRLQACNPGNSLDPFSSPTCRLSSHLPLSR